MNRRNNLDNRVYRVVQTSSAGTVLTSLLAATAGLGRSFSDADILQFSSLAAIFDQWMMETVEIWLTPRGNATTPGYGVDTQYYSVNDYDDDATPGGSAGLMQNQNCIMTSATNGHYRRFRPHIAVAAYGGAFTKFLNSPSTWIDVASTGVKHYGLKVAIDATNANGDLALDLKIRITAAFRNVI